MAENEADADKVIDTTKPNEPVTPLNQDTAAEAAAVVTDEPPPAVANEGPVVEAAPTEAPAEAPAVADPAATQDGSSDPAPVEPPAQATPEITSEGTPPGEPTKGDAASPAKDAAAESAPPAKNAKMKGLLKKLIPIIIILVVLAAAGGGAYWFFVIRNAKPKVDANAKQTELTQEASASASLPLPECVSGFKPFANTLFAICYPQTMEYKEMDVKTDVKEASPGALESIQEFVFSDDIETLTVKTNVRENPNKDACLSLKPVTVSGFPAQRYQVKDNAKTGGGCASTVKKYVTLVGAGNDKPLFYIGLEKEEGSYQSDNKEFEIIEQSFQLNTQ